MRILKVRQEESTKDLLRALLLAAVIHCSYHSQEMHADECLC
jgi:hypothetical protein